MNTLAKITKQLGFIFITLLVVSACKGIKVIDVNKDPTILRVKPYKVECNPEKPSEKLCFLINKKGSKTWDKEKIGSFSDYRWGYDYEIEVTPKTKDKPYKWEKTNLNTETPNRIFELTVTTATKTSIIKDTDKIYSIYGEIKIKCDPDTECETIETRIDYNQLVKFTMSYGSDNSLNIEKIAYLPVKPTLRINHYKVECDHSFTSKYTNGKEKVRFLCLQIQEKNKKGEYGEWKKYAGDIKGFTYNWGYNYEIEVTKLNTSPPIKFAFKRKISEPVKAASDSLFRLTVSLTGIKTADAIKHPSKDKTIYRIYDEINFKCNPTENRGKSECDFIQSHIEQNDAFKFTMMHDKGALKTSGYPCASARSSFKTDCK